MSSDNEYSDNDYYDDEDEDAMLDDVDDGECSPLPRAMGACLASYRVGVGHGRRRIRHRLQDGRER